MNDRIKLAEAMGWHRDWCGGTSELYSLVPPGHEHVESPPTAISCYFNSWFDGKVCAVPDPFTDANDDYACLQFAKEQGNPLWTPFMHHCEQECHQYTIGDWARALLEALGNE